MTNREIRKGSRRQRLFPYAYARRGLIFRLESATLDGDRPAGNIDANAHLLRLETREWQRASLRFFINVKPDVVNRVLPRPTGRTTHPVKYLVAIRCESTLFRHGALVEPASSALDIPTTMEIEIERRQVRDRVEFVPFLVRESTDDSVEAGFARRRGERIVDGWHWEMRVDRIERARSRHLDIRYIKFSDHERFRKLSDRVYILEADTEKPTLWLNRDHPRISQVLDSGGTRGGSARVRDVFFDMISHGVWLQLFMRAAAGINVDGESPYEWHRGVIDEFAPELFPEYDAEGRIEQIRQGIADPVQAADMLRDVDLLLQANHKLARHMTRLVDEVVTG